MAEHEQTTTRSAANWPEEWVQQLNQQSLESLTPVSAGLLLAATFSNTIFGDGLGSPLAYAVGAAVFSGSFLALIRGSLREGKIKPSYRTSLAIAISAILAVNGFLQWVLIPQAFAAWGLFGAALVPIMLATTPKSLIATVAAAVVPCLASVRMESQSSVGLLAILWGAGGIISMAWPALTARRDAFQNWHSDERQKLAELQEALTRRQSQDRDASRRAQAQEKLLEARGEMDGLWEWNLRTDEMYFSPRWRALLGYDSEVRLRTPDDWFNLLHPYDLDEVMARLGHHLKGETDSFECEHRIREVDGSYRWVLSRGRIIYDEDGQATQFAGSQVDIKRLKNYEAELVTQATHDRLTGLPNRQTLLEQLEFDAKKIDRHSDYRYGVAFLDLDRFKYINDTLGHRIGDELLVHVAKRISAAVRDDDLVARLGGDEFVILLRSLKGVNQALEVGARIQAAISDKFHIHGQEITTAASLGLAMCDSAKDGEGLLVNADLAMYEAKRAGRGRVQLFDSDMHRQASRQFSLQNDLPKALEDSEFRLYYQPLVSLDSGRIVGAEALIRWQRGDELVSPAEFIPLAEETGLISGVGSWALHEACRQNRAWLDAGLLPIKMSVNVSARQLAQPDFGQILMSELRSSGLRPEMLQIEVTESELVDSRRSSEAAAGLDCMAALGVGTAIDDFGTGYSSLAYLRKLQCNVLKIDRSFVSDTPGDPKASALARSIISMAHNLGLEVIAEGVETEDQLDFLRSFRCDQIQGFLVARPMPPDEFRALLEKDAPLVPARETRETVGQPHLVAVG